jgi:hypothetical protein
MNQIKNVAINQVDTDSENGGLILNSSRSETVNNAILCGMFPLQVAWNVTAYKEKHMEKVTIWDGMTQTHGFHIDVLRDTKSNDFIAEVKISSPGLAPPKIVGRSTPVMKFEDPVKIRHENLEKLRELIEQFITERYGEILQFFESENSKY